MSIFREPDKLLANDIYIALLELNFTPMILLKLLSLRVQLSNRTKIEVIKSKKMNPRFLMSLLR
jgi:hypothetical protein